MFAKIFSQIFDSSIAEDYIVRHVFMDFLVLCDRDGVVDMTPEAISRRTNVPIEYIHRAIEKLSQPDVKSRSDAENGCRITPLDSHRDWGWQIVNYHHYRDLIDEESRRAYFRDKQRQHRAASKLSKQVKHSKAKSKKITQVEVTATVTTKAVKQDAEFCAGFVLDNLPWSGKEARWAYKDQLEKAHKLTSKPIQELAELMVTRWNTYDAEVFEFKSSIKNFITTGIWLTPEKWSKRNGQQSKAQRDEQQTHEAIAKGADKLRRRHGIGTVDGVDEGNVPETAAD